MGELKLEGKLKLEGTLGLAGKVLVGGAELLVRLLPTDAPHSVDGKPPTPPNDSASGGMVWISGSANEGVKVDGRAALTAAGLSALQGTLKKPLSGQAVGASRAIEINGALALAKGDTITVGPTTMTLTNSGQS